MSSSNTVNSILQPFSSCNQAFNFFYWKYPGGLSGLGSSRLVNNATSALVISSMNLVFSPILASCKPGMSADGNTNYSDVLPASCTPVPIQHIKSFRAYLQTSLRFLRLPATGVWTWVRVRRGCTPFTGACHGSDLLADCSLNGVNRTHGGLRPLSRKVLEKPQSPRH